MVGVPSDGEFLRVVIGVLLFIFLSGMVVGGCVSSCVYENGRPTISWSK